MAKLTQEALLAIFEAIQKEVRPYEKGTDPVEYLLGNIQTALNAGYSTYKKLDWTN